MSLFDALLLDEHREPKEIWIANRTDGQRGSGTQADPRNGGVIAYPSVPITNLISSGTLATATTSTPHGFNSGDLVTISGVKRNIVPADASDYTFDADLNYTGTFAVTFINTTQFTYAMLGPARLSPAVPDTGGIVCWREREQFDVVMRALSANTIIHLGAGVFETKGFSGSILGAIPGSWEIKPAQKIRGAGMGVTTLKLVGCLFAETQAVAIGHGSGVADHFEVSDLTVDCNITGQPNQQVACAAVFAAGSHVRIRRVRAINFGSQTLAYIENFVFVGSAVADGGNHDCVIEDCIAERPSANPISNSTLFHLGGVGHRNFATRNCYVDGRIVYGSPVPVPIDTISYSAGLVTVTTKAPHLLAYPGNAIVSSVTVGGNLINLFNGVFEVDQIISATSFKYKVNTTGSPDAVKGFVGGGVSTHRASIINVIPDDTLEICPALALHPFEVYEFPRTNKIVTPPENPHFRTRNNNVVMHGILKKNPTNPAQFIDSTAFIGSFKIDEYDPAKPNELVFTLLKDPDFDVTKPGEMSLTRAFINVGHFALAAGGGVGTRVEGNRVYHCSMGGPYHDTESTGDTTARNNYYHDVFAAMTENMGPAVSSNSNPVPVSLNHQNGTVIATTTFPHGFTVGDQVIIANTYSGAPKVTITEVPSAFTFKYAKPAAPLPSPSPGYGTYQDVFVAGGTVAVTYQTRLISFSRIQDGSKVFGQVTTSASKHGLIVGDAVRIWWAGAFANGAFPDPNLPQSYNGVFRVTEIINSQTFKYQFIDANGSPYDPGPPGANFSPGYFGRPWQVKRLVFENNVAELAVRHYSGFGYFTGFPIYGGRPFPPEYSVREGIIRSNVIRNINDASAPSNIGIQASGCEQALIEENIITLDSPTPILHSVAGTVNTFNNVSPGGGLLRSTNGDPPYDKAPEVATQVQADLDDAALVSFLNL